MKVQTGLSHDYFLSAAKLNRTFPSAFCEIIDNAIAASPPGAPGFSIDVYVEEQDKDNALDFVVTDGGAGMPKSFVSDGLFLLGPTTHTGPSGPFAYLNQFGMGLKNSLPWLTDETGLSFDLRTGFESSPGKIDVTCVHGKLATDGMECDVCPAAGTIRHLNEGVHARGPNPKVGTRLRFSVSRDKAYSGWKEFGVDRSDVSFKEFVPLLREHLGLTYRDFLPKKTMGSQTFSNSIKVRIMGPSHKGKVQFNVVPVPVPYLPGSRVSTFAVRDGTNVASVRYQRGRLDPGVKRVLFHRPAELTQGFDMMVGGKVIEPAAFDRVWNRGRHDTFNYLTGEIRLDITSGSPPLVATKDRLDWSSKLVMELVKEIKRQDMNASFLWNSLLPPSPPPPKPKKKLWYGGEDDLRDLLQDTIDGLKLGTTRTEHPAWEKPLTGIEPGVAADLTFDSPKGFLIIEAKWPVAKVDDVYQLRLYWDGFCHTNAHTNPPASPHPTVAVLVAQTFKPGATWLAKYLTGQSCPCGKKYKILCCGWSALGLPPKKSGGGANSKKVSAMLAKWLP